MSRTDTPDTEAAPTAEKADQAAPVRADSEPQVEKSDPIQKEAGDQQKADSPVTDQTREAVPQLQQQQQPQPDIGSGIQQQEIPLHAATPTPDRTPTPVPAVTDGAKMNGLSFSELCCLFCCPPCPGQIAAKLAFLPPEPTYSFIPDESNVKFTLSLTDRAEWQYTQRELEAIEVFYSRTTRGNRIGCMFIRAANPRYTILFSHGNAVDLGQMSSFYLGLGSRINCNIFSYDYSGYGVSSGESALFPVTGE
jgi:hypothetical protein